MSVVGRRSKMISFRLSEEEYDQFRLLCGEHGYRSISEVARFAIDSLIRGETALPGENLQKKVTELDSRLVELDRKMDSLSTLMNELRDNCESKRSVATV